MNTSGGSDMVHSLLPLPNYLPPKVDASLLNIAVIGCGGISEKHLEAYKSAGFHVTLLCDRTLAKAEHRRDQYFPFAAVTTSTADVFSDEKIDIVDIATHVGGRSQLIVNALEAGKHVLSQKPFVRDLDEGEQLIDLAESSKHLLAVNHNGRWAPHFSVALTAVERGDIGKVTSADFSVYWPHDQIVQNDPHFSVMPDLILYDFGIHWFDMVAQLLGQESDPVLVFANIGTRHGQSIPVPTEADVVIEFEHGRATLAFRGSAPRAESGSYRIEGTDGVITHSGLSLGGSEVRLETRHGKRTVDLEGDWWSNGMTGSMAELMGALIDNRPPRNSAKSSLNGLALCFAAMQSARTRLPVDPRQVRSARFDND